MTATFSLPQITLFLRHCVNFVSYLFGGEFDIVNESLLGFVTVGVHHLEDGVLVAEIHIGDTAAMRVSLRMILAMVNLRERYILIIPQHSNIPSV